MQHYRRQARAAFRDLTDQLGATYRMTAQVDGYRVGGVDPGSVDYTSSDWDGSDAEAAYPNPSDDGTDLDTLASHYLFVPASMDSDDPPPKSAFKAPFRDGPGGSANTNALLAVIQAINGARGGFDGIDQDTLRDGFDAAVQHLVAAGEYDDADDAPDFEAEAAQAPADGQQRDVLEASAGRIRFDVDADRIQAATDADGATLTGIIWGAGDHDLALGGEPTPVRVPGDTIQPTFEALREDVAAGDVTLGFDHPGPESVAAKTGIVDIGVAQDVALSGDGEHIVLTDSSLTNDQAVEAAKAGDFDDLDWSVVADVAIRRDQDGSVVREDGRVVLDATRITRIDAVDTGAVDAASIERDQSALPDLQDHTEPVRQAAAAATPKHRTDAVTALQASVTDIRNIMQDPNIDPTDVDDLEAAREQLSAAADVIEEQQDDLEAAQQRADGFESLLSAHDVDPEDYDDPQAAAQAVIDKQTIDVREEIASLEADLAAHDVDDVESRAEDLAGRSPSDLQNLLNARKADAFDREQARQQKGRAAAKGDTTGRANFAGGADGGDEAADDLALQAMDGSDRIKAEANDMSPSQFVQHQYGVDASQYDQPDELHDDIMAAMNGGDA